MKKEMQIVFCQFFFWTYKKIIEGLMGNINMDMADCVQTHLNNSSEKNIVYEKKIRG